jgi:hypothetical protein
MTIQLPKGVTRLGQNSPIRKELGVAALDGSEQCTALAIPQTKGLVVGPGKDATVRKKLGTADNVGMPY